MSMCYIIPDIHRSNSLRNKRPDVTIMDASNSACPEQMPAVKSSKPGPPPTSCQTCRQRRKKCDLAKPNCERCLKGGFECLGYEDCKPGPSVRRGNTNEPISRRPRPILSAVPVQPAGPKLGQRRGLTVIGVSEDPQSPNDADGSHNPAPLKQVAESSRSTTRSPSTPNDGYAIPSPDDLIHTRPQSQHQLITRQLPSTHRSSTVTKSHDAAFGVRSAGIYVSQFIEAWCKSIPPSVVSTQTIGEARFVHIISEYQLRRTRFWFTTPPVSVSGAMINRLRESKVMIWALCLGTKLFEALNQDPSGTPARRYIDKFKQKFPINSVRNLSLKDAGDYLLAQLELSYLSFVTVDTPSGYSFLQQALPRFLHLVAHDPNLTTEYPNGSLVVSFPRTFNSTQHPLKRFVVYDTTTSLVLGVPPLVEYGYDGECDSASHGFQWVHGIPVTFVETISQINAWRAGSRVAPLDDWRVLESRVLAWQGEPTMVEEEGSDTTKIAARLAVQEGWRHVSLIYIYMGMCGAPSHDSRVQASIRQIIQLGESVAKLPLGIHTFAHYVVAGIGAHSEAHRSIIREKLFSFKGMRVWLFRGPEFSRILDHLWQGVGAEGAPVTWDDYARSRCAVIPL